MKLPNWVYLASAFLALLSLVLLPHLLSQFGRHTSKIFTVYSIAILAFAFLVFSSRT